MQTGGIEPATFQLQEAVSTREPQPPHLENTTTTEYRTSQTVTREFGLIDP